MNDLSKRQYLGGVQALRGMAAMMVVVAHLIGHGSVSPAVEHLVLLLGRFGVIVFFVISGFVIHYASGEHRMHPVAFAVRRIFRVVPLYWMATTLVMVLALIKPDLYKNTIFDLEAFAKSLLFIPYEYPVGSSDWRPLFKLGWTLNYEMFFYAVMLLFFWTRTSRMRAIGITLALSAIVCLQFQGDPRSIMNFYANFCLIPFLVGIWIAEGWRAGVFERLSAMGMYGASCIAIFLTLVLFLIPSQISENGRYWPLLLTVPAASLMVSALSLEGMNWKSRTLNFVGDVSYSVYLLHMFVVGAVWHIVHRMHVGLSGGVMVAVVVIGVLVTLAVSYISYRWFEMPINRIGSRMARALERRSLSA